MMIKPISPSEAKKAIPDFVIQVVNNLIEENLRDGEFSIKAKDIKTRVKRELDDTCDFDNRWLDFEPLYEAAGWHVSYTQPDYTESFDSYFTFKAKS